MSLTCHDKIWRVGRRCYEGASDLSATSRTSRAREIWRTTRHTDKRAAPAADRRPTNQVSAWQAEQGSRPTRRNARHPRSILARGWRVARVDEDITRMLYVETAPVEFIGLKQYSH